MTAIRIAIGGAPRTKKNHNAGRIVVAKRGGFPCPRCRVKLEAQMFPSTAWRTWLNEALVRVDGFRLLDMGGLPALGREDDRGLVTSIVRPWRPLAEPLNCRAVFYRDAVRGDLIGYCQGLADFLQERGALADDKWIQGWDGSRLDVAVGQPRVEVELTPLLDRGVP